MSYSKLEAKCSTNWQSAYAQLDFQYRRHFERFKRFVLSLKPRLTCQECGGSGKYEEYEDHNLAQVLTCGFCEGTGFVTPHIRSVWLRIKREEKRKHCPVHGSINVK